MSFIELTTADILTLEGICESLGVPRFNSSGGLNIGGESTFDSVSVESITVDNKEVLTEDSQVQLSGGLLQGGGAFGSDRNVSISLPQATSSDMSGYSTNLVVTPSAFNYGWTERINIWSQTRPYFSSGIDSPNSYFVSPSIFQGQWSGDKYFYDDMWVFGHTYFSSGIQVEIQNYSVFRIDGASNAYFNINYGNHGLVGAYVDVTVGSVITFNSGSQLIFSSTASTTFYDASLVMSNGSFNMYGTNSIIENCYTNLMASSMVLSYSSGGPSNFTVSSGCNARFDGNVGFWKSEVGQAAAISNATDSTNVITKFNQLLGAMRSYGLIAE